MKNRAVRYKDGPVLKKSNPAQYNDKSKSGKKGHYFMGTKSTGIIGRINDFGQLTIPKKLRRELKINDRTALELGITRVNGRKALYAVPYIPFEEHTLRQVKSALTSLARQLPTGYEVGIFEFEESYAIAHASTGKSAQVEDYWFTVEPMTRSMFEKARDSKHYGLCQFKGLNILYYPVFSHGDVLLVLAIAGKDIPDDVAEPVRMTAEILSAMLS